MRIDASTTPLPSRSLRTAGNGDWPVDSDYDVRPPLMGTQYHPRSFVHTGEMSEAEAAAAGEFVSS